MEGCDGSGEDAGCVQRNQDDNKEKREKETINETGVGRTGAKRLKLEHFKCSKERGGWGSGV
jgi:hypothetical protein